MRQLRDVAGRRNFVLRAMSAGRARQDRIRFYVRPAQPARRRTGPDRDAIAGARGYPPVIPIVSTVRRRYDPWIYTLVGAEYRAIRFPTRLRLERGLLAMGRVCGRGQPAEAARIDHWLI